MAALQLTTQCSACVCVCVCVCACVRERERERERENCACHVKSNETCLLITNSNVLLYHKANNFALDIVT